MIVIGLTGNIATGKSAVMAMLAQLGALVIDADRLVHQLLEADPGVRSRVLARFGLDVQQPDGSIDRGRLGAVVFRDPAALRDLERILHPRVEERVAALIAASGAPVAVVEAIKLLEGKLRDRCDAIWVTDCSEQEQIRRLVDGRGMTEQEARLRVRSQAPQADKRAQADLVIDTSTTLAQTRQQVERAWRSLRSKDEQ